MPRLALIAGTTLLALLVLPPPAWANWEWPLRGEVVTPYRNGGDPYASGQHRGIDIAGAPGMQVTAAAGGEVRFAGTAGSSGVTVSVRTADGRYDTSYLHLASVEVRAGERVDAGDAIGAVGTTGTRSSDRPHLHFGVRDAGSRHAYHDPLAFLPPPPPAAEPPRAAPAPQPAPVPLAPAPVAEPVRAPAGRRRPVRAPARRRVPVRRPVPIRAPGRAPARRAAGRPAPAPRALPTGFRDIAPGRRAKHTPPARAAPRRDGAPGHEAGTGARLASPAPHLAGDSLAARAQPSSHGTPGRSTVPGQAGSAGPDLGLLLACLGLVAAAAMLGLTGEGRRTTSRSAGRFSKIAAPLMGRR